MTLDPEKLCERLTALEKEVAVLGADIQGKFQAASDARTVDRLEVLRRLDLLNGEANRLLAMQTTYLPREVHDEVHVRVDDQIKSLQDFRSNMQGRLGVFVVLVPAAISLAFLFLEHMLAK